MAEDGIAVFGDSAVPRIRAVVAKGSGWDMENNPTERHKSNMLAIATLPECLEALELCFHHTMGNPENRELQPLHVRVVAALTKAGYTFP